jgi:release factor glutamine methyltransferase
LPPKRRERQASTVRAGAGEASARDAAARLKRAGVPEPAASAEVLLSELLGIGRAELALYERPLTDEQSSLYEAWIYRRLQREPVQRILGYAYFRNLTLDLNEDTLIPRPDTECVVDLALERIDLRGYPCVVLDVGTGSGAIAISMAQERPRCEVHATEVSDIALEAARANADRNETQVRFHHADVVSGLGFLEGGIDLLVSNPPYVDETSASHRLAPEVRKWDPPVALFSGTDELAFFKRIFAETPPLLKDGADVVLEIGDGQAEKVLNLGESAGFSPLAVRDDLAGTPRAVLLKWQGS